MATAGTRHLANHPPEEKEKINQLKKALKDLVVFTNPPQRENPASPPNPYLYKITQPIIRS